MLSTLAFKFNLRRCMEAAAVRREKLVKTKIGRFKPKNYGSILEQVSRIKKPTDNPIIVLEKVGPCYTRFMP